MALAVSTAAALLPATSDAGPARDCRALSALRAGPGYLVSENAAANRARLSRIPDLRTVRRFVRAKRLVPVPARTRTYEVVGVRPALRVARPWTVRFVKHLAQAFHARFRGTLRITSLTRTADVQRALRTTNGNAAPAEGRLRSTHLTGATVDISKRPMQLHEVQWLRAALGRLAKRELVSAIEEFAQPHFHVMVFPAYGKAIRRNIIALLRGGC